VVRQSPGGLDVALTANRVCRLLGVPADLTRRDRWPVQASVTKDSDGLVFGSLVDWWWRVHGAEESLVWYFLSHVVRYAKE
jgi:hypothetical protein